MLLRLRIPMLAALPLTLMLGGCATTPDTESGSGADLAWGTKERSTLEPDMGFRHLQADTVSDATVHELRHSAISLLEQATESTNPLLRANAIEALQHAPAFAEPRLRDALRDRNRGVRFVATMVVGDLEMTALRRDVRPLLDDPSASVRAAAIYAMTRCGADVDPSPLGAMIVSDDLEIRGNSALVLGRLGDATAMPLLRDAMDRTSVRRSIAANRLVELQIAEAMFRLSETASALQMIRSALFTPAEQGEITVLACQILGELGDAAYRTTLVDKAGRVGERQEPAEIRLAAARAVAILTPEQAPIEPVLSYVGSDAFTIRAQAAHALGYFNDVSVRPTLTTMLHDPNAMVQVAAAGAILRAFPDR